MYYPENIGREDPIMRRIHVMFLAVVLSIIAGLQCAKKEDEKAVPPREKKITLEEADEIIVSLPAASQESQLILTTRSGETLSGLIAENLFWMLSDSTGPRVLLQEAEKPGIQMENTPACRLTSDVIRDGDQVLIRYRLVSLPGESVLAEQTVHDSLGGLYAAATRMADTITRYLPDPPLKNEPSPESRNNLFMNRFIQARSLLKMDTRKSTNQAVQEFKSLLRADSTFLPAHLALAEAYLKIPKNGWDRNPVWLRLAQETCHKALSMSPESGRAYLLLGEIASMRGDFRQADSAFRKALARNPNLEEAWVELGKILLHHGLYTSCLDAYDRALELNPYSVPVLISRALVLTGLNRYTEARQVLENLISRNPGDAYLHSYLALVLLYQDDMERARREIERGSESGELRDFSAAVQAMIFARTQNLDEALRLVELEVKPVIGNNPNLAIAAAAVYNLLGQKGRSVHFMEKAIQYGYMEYPWLANDPHFKALWSDDRAVSLLDSLKNRWIENRNRYPGLP
jgi:tetratricopeptide (TPR) repeat protein